MEAISDSVSSSSSDDSRTSTALSPRTDVARKPTSSLLPSTVNDETSTLSSIKINFLTKSTIYRRHEARLARSYALRDDPRPALLRVMSGLPGFRMIVPPYQSESKKYLEGLDEQKQNEKYIPATKVAPGAYSEETLFDQYSVTTDNTVGAASTGTNHANDYSSALASEGILQAMLATGFCSGTAEYVFAYCNDNRNRGQKYATSSSLSPFHNSNTGGSMTPKQKASIQNSSLFFHPRSSAVSNLAGPEVYKRYTGEMPNAIRNNTLLNSTNKARPSTGVFSKALMTAFPTSLLFGTKVLFDSVLENQENDAESNEQNSPSVTNGILSSAFAGGVVGSSQLALLQVRNLQQLQPSSLSMIDQQRLTSGYSSGLMGRNVVAAVLYFSVYDGVSSISATSKVSQTDFDASAYPLSSSAIHSDCIKQGKDTLGIVVGGALAGAAHTAAMNYHRYGQYGSMIWWSRIMLPATSRAAPIHAFVFYGYEKMKEGTKNVP